MESLLGIFTNQFLVFLLVLTRVSGLMLLTPVWGARVVPPRVRALLALALALIISPLVADAPQTIPGDLLQEPPCLQTLPNLSVCPELQKSG